MIQKQEPFSPLHYVTIQFYRNFYTTKYTTKLQIVPHYKHVFGSTNTCLEAKHFEPSQREIAFCPAPWTSTFLYAPHSRLYLWTLKIIWTLFEFSVSSSQKPHCVSITKKSELMLGVEITAIYIQFFKSVIFMCYIMIVYEKNIHLWCLVI
jgi:hypothetical protein